MKRKLKKKYFTSAVSPFVDLPQNFFFQLMFFNHCRALVSMPPHRMTHNQKLEKLLGIKRLVNKFWVPVQPINLT